MVERWRNPYSHGGFEKGHEATIYLHVPGLSSALPVGLSSMRDSLLFSFMPASGADVADVFALFDELDTWFKDQHSEAIEWIESGEQVRFDKTFRDRVAVARAGGVFGQLLDATSYEMDRAANMDY